MNDIDNSSLEAENEAYDRSRLPWIIAIFALGMALLFCVCGGPLVLMTQQSRELSRRNMCQFRMYEVGVALSEYYQSYGAFPPGWDSAQPEDSNSPVWGWQSRLLPNLADSRNQLLPEEEDGGLGNLLTTLSSEQLELLAEPSNFYICPSDDSLRYDGANHPDRRMKIDGREIVFGVSNFVGNTGHLHDIIADEPNTGVFFGNSQITDADVTDGLGFTVAFGERDLDRCRAGNWPGVLQPRNNDGGPSIWSVVAGAKPKLNADPWDSDTKCGEGFSSFHAEIVNVALLDGSVISLNIDIDSQWSIDPVPGKIGVLQQMMIRDDGIADSLPVEP